MFSPLLADRVIDISDMPQATGSNKHIWRISRLIYPKSLLASYILLSWLKIYLIDISLSISLKMSSDKLYSDAVRSELSSDEDVASPVASPVASHVASPVASPIITGISKKVFLQKSQTLNSETERARCTRVMFPIKSPKKKLLITLCTLRV
jgi:hypothetical protein